MSRSEVSIQDLDGDGFPEYLTSSDSDQLSVSLDTIERTNMLRQVNRPLGSTIALAYERSGNTIDQPQNKWVLARVEVFDGFAGDGTDTLATNFTYEDGYWDREEREFYGYARVIEDHMNLDSVGGEAVYRTITRDFLNDTYYDKGLLAASTTADAAGNLYLATTNTYAFVDVETGNAVSQPDSLIATVFPQLIRTDNQFFEGQAVAGKAAVLIEEPAQGIHQHRPVPDQTFSGPEDSGTGLLLFTLGGHKAHLWALCGHNDGFGVCSIVLLSLHKGPHVLRRDHLRLMPEGVQRPHPVVGTATGFHHHDRGFQIGHKPEELDPGELLSKKHLARHRSSVQLKHRLRQIDTNHHFHLSSPHLQSDLSALRLTCCAAV